MDDELELGGRVAHVFRGVGHCCITNLGPWLPLRLFARPRGLNLGLAIRSPEIVIVREAYWAKFPGWGGVITPAVERAMERALATGQDQPLLIKQRKANERHAAEYDAKLAAEHAQPFTAELEQHYTTRIKNWRLREGDCQRPWQNYFAYREANPNTVEALTGDDLKYLSLWTVCPV